ncbi:hypothetical protein U2F10_12055 [Leptothoe sp. EHU-05/26/07-4]
MATLPDMVSYFNQETMVSILVPKSWSGAIVDSSKFRIFGLPEPGFEEYFDEYKVSMSYELQKPDSSNDSWFESLIAQNNALMQQDYNEYKLLQEQTYELGGHKTYCNHYSWREENTGLRLFQMQAFIVGSPYKFYLINAAVLESLERKYIPIFENILNSTRIIPRN